MVLRLLRGVADPRRRSCRLLMAALVGVVGCADDSPTGPESTWRVVSEGPATVIAPAGSTEPVSLAVRVLGPDNSTVSAARVQFRVRTGRSTLLDELGVSDGAGIARADLRPATVTDTTVVSVIPVGASGRALELTLITLVPPTLTAVAPTQFKPGDTVQVRGSRLFGTEMAVEFEGQPGTVLRSVSNDTLIRVVVPPCLSAGSVPVQVVRDGARSQTRSVTLTRGAALVQLTPYSALTVRGSGADDCLLVPSDGASYLVVPHFAVRGEVNDPISWRLGAPTAATSVLRAPSLLQMPLPRHPESFEATLRRFEREHAPMAAAALPPDAPSLQAQTVGSTRDFKVLAALDLSQFKTVRATLRYVGTNLLTYVDERTPAGFSTEQYLALSKLMDEQLYPIPRAAFGAQSDLDRNGKLIVLFTPEVNALVRAADCAQRGFVTGFFFGGDLIPNYRDSNKGEIYYSVVPDELEQFSCKHTVAEVDRLVPTTFLHEMQHMISYYQHAIARSGESEESWLNEGLSHLSEELGSIYFERKYPAPLGRATATQLFPDSSAGFIAPQMLNAYIYLNTILDHSVTTYEGLGSIEERGATWLFLRWLTDQKGESILHRLVQTKRTGVANLEEKTGESLGRLFGDFSLALYTDSLVGVSRTQIPSRLRFKSRNVRLLMARYAAVAGFPNPFPLRLLQLNPGNSLSGSMLEGTMLHSLLRTTPGAPPVAVRFTTPEGAPFAASRGAQISLFRLP